MLLKKNRAVGYCRYSSDMQTENSIEAQQSAIESFAEKNGYTIVGWYVDRAKSATSTQKRENFKKMIQDSELGNFDMVIVHRYDRFARNAHDSFAAEKKLNINGVQLTSVVEYMQNGPQASLMRSIYYGFNEYFSKSLALETAKGLKNIAKKCLFTGGNVPLGYYIKNDKTYGVVEKEAEVVRLIFESYISGMTLGSIVDELNTKGYTNKKGGVFNKNSLNSILRNEKYSGKYVYNKVVAKGVDNKRNGHKYKDEAEWIVVEGGVPAIVGKELFERVQLVLKDRKIKPGMRAAKTTYLLTGLVKCGCCSYSMVGNRRTPKNKPTYVSYRCGNRKKTTALTTTCNNKEIRRDNLEDFVLSYIQNYILNPVNISTICERINNHLKNQQKDTLKERGNIEVQIKDIETKINNIINAISNGFFQPEFKDKIEELKKDKLDLEVKLRDFEIRECESVTEEEFMLLAQNFKEYVTERNVPEIKRVLKYFIKEIIVDRDHVKIVLNVALFLNTETKEELEEVIDKGREELYKTYSRRAV